MHEKTASRWAPHALILALGAGNPAMAGGGENCDGTRITPPLPRQNLRFGTVVASDGETLMVSAPGYPGGATVWVYAAGPTEWDLTQQLTGGIGQAIQVAGDTAFLGAPGHNRVFVYSRAGATWELAQELAPSDFGGSGFGRALALDGDVLAVGANRGVLIYELDDATQLWNFRQTLIPNDGALTNDFGRAIALEGGIVAAADPFQDSIGNNAGAIYLYRFDSATESWQFEQKLQPETPEDGGTFGHDLALEGGVLFVGAPDAASHQADTGMVAVYEYDNPSESWVLAQRLVPFDGTIGDEFGWTLTVDGDDLIVAAIVDDDMGKGAGSAYRYRRENGRWVQIAKIMPEDLGNRSFFASDLVIAGDQILAGHAGFSSPFSQTGTVWVFPRDVTCFPATEIHSFTVAHGTLMAGDLFSLLEPDDDRMGIRSVPGFTAAAPNIVDLRVMATCLEETPESLDMAIEGRLNHPGGIVTLRLRNWSNNFLKNVWEYPLGTVEHREVLENRWNITASEHVRESDGAVEMSIRPSVVALFSLSGFDAFFDFIHIEID